MLRKINNIFDYITKRKYIEKKKKWIDNKHLKASLTDRVLFSNL